MSEISNISLYTFICFCEYYDEPQDWIKSERPENRDYANVMGTTDIFILLTDDGERTNSETCFCTQKETVEYCYFITTRYIVQTLLKKSLFSGVAH